MITIFGSLFGLFFIILGLHLWTNLSIITKYLEGRYEYYKNTYDNRYKNATSFKKILAFLFIRRHNYYHNIAQTKFALLFIAPSLIILGVFIILSSLSAT